MEKLLLKKIMITFGIIAIILFSLVSGTIYHSKTSYVMNDLGEMIDQVELSYKNNLNIIDAKVDLYKKDYLNRAYAINFMISINPSIRNKEGLQRIQKLMEVESINIIDYSGEIVLSSDDQSMGLNLLFNKEYQPFWELIKTNDMDANVIQLDSKNIIDGAMKDFIGVKSTCKDYSVIQIGIDKKVLDEIKSSLSIGTTLGNIPTVYEKTLVAVDGSNGDIVGITKNNDQELVIDNIKTQEELVNLLKSSCDGRLLKVNGSYQFLKTKIVDDLILIGIIKANIILSDYLFQLFYLALTTLIIFIIIIILLKIYIRKYILKDFLNIQKNINEIMSDNYEIEFKTENNTEIKPLINMLNDWKNSYKYKSNRMSRIISSLNSHVAVFECLYYIDRNFFSENTQSILGIDNVEWNKIKNKPCQFEKYINNLISNANEDGVINVNNKFIVITSFKVDNEFYGIILDKTKDVESNNDIRNELQIVQEAAEKDFLTDLINRNRFEKCVKDMLEINSDQGIMIFFDLDNFKIVNDTLGHPEGDKLLVTFAQCLKSNFRENDIIARLGGDEFVIFIPSNLPIDIIESKLKIVLECVRKKLHLYYEKYRISTSIGVAYVNDKVKTYEDLYVCSDVALYIAKGLGKDRYYINKENIRCMRGNCIKCTNDCKKRKLLGL